MTWGDGWPLWAWLLVDTLATYRLTRLVVKDTITQPVRRRIVDLADRHDGKPFGGPLAPLANGPVRLAAELVTCPWCSAVWVAAAVVALTYLFAFAWSLAAFGLVCAAAAGLLSERGA